LAEARGRIIVFTDDDVVPPRDWLVKLCAPLLRGEADVVAGGVRLASHLRRAWMTPGQRAWLADTEFLGAGTPGRIVSANMAIARSVLKKVPEFDPELGPGALGYGEDTLFSQQLKLTGCRVVGVLDPAVEHHFPESRLERQSWLEAARKMGRTDAYLAHHWEHAQWSRPRWLLLKAVLRFAVCRASSRHGTPPAADPALPRLADATRHLHACLHYLRERRKPRHYTQRGSVKQPDLNAGATSGTAP
jgi:GT2 family glycosyltransferase